MTTLYMWIIICFISVNLGMDSPDFEKAFEEFKANFTKQWTQQTLKYDGPDTKVILTISNKVFHTSTNVLLNSKHGNTFFIHEFLGMDKHSINCDQNKNDKHLDEGDLFKMDEAIKNKMDVIYQQTDKVIELYFDRDPKLFAHILNYLRGYQMTHHIYDLGVRKLEKLLSDAQYYGIIDLEEMVTNALYSRFNPYLCAPSSVLTLSDADKILTRTSGGYHYTCSVYGILYTGTRYVEFEIITHGEKRQMIGVTQANNFKSGLYPGHARVKGISL
eukprot:56605_1